MEFEKINYRKSQDNMTYTKLENHLKHSFITTIKFEKADKMIILNKKIFIKSNKKFLRGMPISLELEEIKAICDKCSKMKFLPENYEDLKYLCQRYNYKISKIRNVKDDYVSVLNGMKLKKGDFLRSETLVFCYRNAFKTIDISRYLINKYGDRVRDFEIILRPEDILILRKFCEIKNWK